MASLGQDEGIPCGALERRVVVKCHREIVMKLNRIFGVVVAAGLLATTAVMAQDAQQGPQAVKPRPRYGEFVSGPSTTDAQGVSVAKPNPISREEDEGVLGGIGTTPGPLTDDSNVPDSAKPSDTEE